MQFSGGETKQSKMKTKRVRNLFRRCKNPQVAEIKDNKKKKHSPKPVIMAHRKRI